MERYKAGMLAKSMAGHDAGTVYVIIRSEASYVYLVDGRLRRFANPKKKKIKHVRLIGPARDVAGADDAAVRRILKEYRNKIRSQIR